MSSTQNSTLVLDTSVLPKRPKVSDVQKFMAEKLKLDLTLVKRIQVHNLKNIVRLGMTSLEVAEQVASKHHLKHFMECDETQIPVPIYVESSAVDVRAFDLPEDISNEAIRKFFEKYGEVISIRNEVWRNFFPGLENGVKVLKMRLIHPIPSIVTVEGESTLIEYKNQPKTGVKPKTPRCSEAQQTTSQLTPRNNQQQLDQQQWPPLSPTPTESNSATKNQQQNNNVESHTKRQRSVEENSDEDQTKKLALTTRTKTATCSSALQR